VRRRPRILSRLRVCRNGARVAGRCRGSRRGRGVDGCAGCGGVREAVRGRVRGGGEVGVDVGFAGGGGFARLARLWEGWWGGGEKVRDGVFEYMTRLAVGWMLFWLWIWLC